MLLLNIIVVENVLLNDHFRGQTVSLKEFDFCCCPVCGNPVDRNVREMNQEYLESRSYFCILPASLLRSNILHRRRHCLR